MLPIAPPNVHRKFQFTDLNGNSNKFWEIKAWEAGGEWLTQTIYGRVGDENYWPAPNEAKPLGSFEKVERKIKDKTRPGRSTGTYQEVSIGNIVLDFGEGEIGRISRYIVDEASEYISTYFAGSTSDLSPEQIAMARDQLEKIGKLNAQWGYDDMMRRAVERYFTIIPTILPRKIDPEKVIKDFLDDLKEQEERLNQLEASIQVQQGTPSQLLGVELSLANEEEVAEVTRRIMNTRVHRGYEHLEIVNVFRIDEPRPFEDAGNAQLLFHGTRSRNVRHILRSGLTLPKVKSNGWAFGPGLYFADKFSKSANYCSASKTKLIFIAEVGLGNMYVTPAAESYRTAPPNGYDSIAGIAGTTRGLMFNEYIVFNERQQRLRYLVEYS